MDSTLGQERPATHGGWQTILIFITTLAVTFAAASLGAIHQPGAWYAGLEKPDLTPPNWIFGPVWTALYLLMGVAAGLVWRKAGMRGASTALGLYMVQLVLNSAWSWLFFGLHEPGWAFADILILWLAIVATIVTFARVSAAAGWLMAPYLAWVSFATYLNFMFWRLNG